ncbi:MAG: response regulator [Candidatus Magnetomorum sp.]|nr:response regulator [Candidatus Magnetomorum sp.]
MNILVVDDFAFARRIIKNVLKEIGMNNVTEVSSGTAALIALNKNEFGLIVTDFNMPGMNGIELVRKIRAIDATTATPIIMVTSDGNKSVLLEATEAGVNAFLNKPFTKEEFVEKIDRLFA